MINQRSKGQRGERELFSLLSDLLGFVVKRRIDTTREGGCDSLDIPGWSCEVKFSQRYLSKYWDQTVEQADKDKRKPVLFWRKKYGEWVAFIDLSDVGCLYIPRRSIASVSIETFSLFVRETL